MNLKRFIEQEIKYLSTTAESKQLTIERYVNLLEREKQIPRCKYVKIIASCCDLECDGCEEREHGRFGQSFKTCVGDCCIRSWVSCDNVDDDEFKFALQLDGVIVGMVKNAIFEKKV